MIEKSARIISFVLHPLFIPLFMAVFIFKLNVYPFTFYTDKALYIVTALTFVFNIITPVFFISILKKAGFITSLLLENRKDRILPLFVFAMLLYLNAMISRKWELPPLWEVTVLLTAMLTIMTIAISFITKISLHLTGWGGLTGLLIVLISYYQADYLIPFTVVLLLSGVSAWSRALLNAHKAGELIAGFVLGCLTIAGGLIFVISLNRA